MTTIRVLSIALALGLSAAASLAQQAPAAAAAPHAAASMPSDCARPKAMHGTSKEAMPMEGPCMTEAASAPKKNRRPHDHGKFHKQQ